MIIFTTPLGLFHCFLELTHLLKKQCLWIKGLHGKTFLGGGLEEDLSGIEIRLVFSGLHLQQAIPDPLQSRIHCTSPHTEALLQRFNPGVRWHASFRNLMGWDDLLGPALGYGGHMTVRPQAIHLPLKTFNLFFRFPQLL